MTLKWLAVVIASVSLTGWLTGNVVLGLVDGGELPLPVNLLALTVAGTAVVLAVLAELNDRLNDRLTAITEFLVGRLDEIEARAGDRNAGFVEGYLLHHDREATVVPFVRPGRDAAER
ncbi:hypothetical protein E1091_18180 [Micromonospora fluostatini]|uniref:Histidine kinase n=2 Tax=Micromonospora TaxID=1873 RepID=A0A136PTP1_9ACTN|nr:hypothetical protein [Micromonospora rosaria]KXK61782.1 hypothetical protein AWW66_11875 [Micromonospora rosaria]TDB83505.1 hypothetical protein E1091_18180 [Micromonospora fluostatini]